VNLRDRTHGFTSHPKKGVLRIFFALKNPTVSAGFEPANLGTYAFKVVFVSNQHVSAFLFPA
jgi:hypothetical protein